jgi:N-acetylglutamate synthase-like GNAT family acetyltransferase
LHPERIAAGDVWIASAVAGQIAGVVTLAPDDAPGTLDLNKLPIEPRHIRDGVGRALLAQAIAEVRRRGAERLTILADPNAADFFAPARTIEAPTTRSRASCSGCGGPLRKVAISISVT